MTEMSTQWCVFLCVVAVCLTVLGGLALDIVYQILRGRNFIQDAFGPLMKKENSQ